MKYYLIIALLLTFSIQAAVYRSVDESGNVIFSDIESEKSEEIIIDMSPSYEAPPASSPNIIPNNIASEKKKEPQPVNYQLSITSPVQNENFHNPESISVQVAISPALNALDGDILNFELDGRALGDPQTLTSTELVEINRGSHILTVSVSDKAGKVLKKSKSTLFHVHRGSASH